MNVNSRGHNLDTRFDLLFSEIKHPPVVKIPVGVPPLLSDLSSEKSRLALTFNVIYSALNAPFK
jgi:hypothetical protein